VALQDLHRQLAMGGRAVLPPHRQEVAKRCQRDCGAAEGSAADSLQRQPGDTAHADVLSIRIQPDEGFSFEISSKSPGPHVNIDPVKMDFHYKAEFAARRLKPTSACCST
jgi:hypothetical protein